MNVIWAILILGGVLFAAINGTMAESTQAVIEAAKAAVELAIGSQRDVAATLVSPKNSTCRRARRPSPTFGSKRN